MTANRFESERYFLRDDVRQVIDFSRTDQNLNKPAPPLQKPCPPELPRIDLPNGMQALSRLCRMPLGEAIARRKSVRTFSATSFSMDELSAILWGVQGVRKVLSPSCALRSVPSAGARHAFETYVAVMRAETLAPGLYRYLPFDGQLAQLREDEHTGREAAHACMEQEFVGGAAAVFFWTAIPARMEWRYDRAAHKVIALDAGHVCQNLYLVCESMGAGVCAIAAYDQAACDRFLGVDGTEEFTIYIGAAGKR